MHWTAFPNPKQLVIPDKSKLNLFEGTAPTLNCLSRSHKSPGAEYLQDRAGQRRVNFLLIGLGPW
jgi:hypothetical protein